MIELRPYQNAALQAIYDYWRSGGGNPLVDLATGTGKSMVVAKLAQDVTAHFPDMRVLILVHVRELVAQNFRALLRVWPDAPAGIYSAGLGKRDGHHRITFASIQSVYNKAAQLGPRDLVVIDEAHLVPSSGEGMYHKLLERLRDVRPDLRVCGLTATPYRLDSGRLDTGDDALFDETVFTYGIGQGIRDGYLSPLRSKAGAREIDVSEVQRRGGEFVPASLEAAADQITAEAVREIVEFGATRKAWLVFCAGVQHALHVANALKAAGVAAATVSGETPLAERDRIINAFRRGELQALTNANVLTTGFDVPQVDLVAMLRPTLSTSLYVQIIGRGTRIAPGKDDCLILDFAGNLRRHGPVDAVVVGGRSGKGNTGEETGRVGVGSVRGKTCPECEGLVYIAAPKCEACGHEFPVKPKHEAAADGSSAVLSTEKVPPRAEPVLSWQFDQHFKTDRPPSVCVTYLGPLNRYREWLGFEHGGPAAYKACQWWSRHGGQTPFPRTAVEAIERQAELRKPATISVRPNGKFFDIVGRSFESVAA
jgi:DNA repair protein RadD